jgi:glucose-1-phosphate cytidylyltransferase
MKVVILAGGRGTRLAEETDRIPKPMVEIGGRPILWHIMKGYDSFGFRDFVLACGYKSGVIKDYFDGFPGVSVVDTGLDTLTAGRLKRLTDWLPDDDFLVTYGDGVADVNIRELVAFHKAHGRLATVTAVRPPARFGSLTLDGDTVVEFSEKEQGSEGWINGGFLAFHRGVLDRISGDTSSLEYDVLRGLSEDRELAAFRHSGFWHPMDTLRDRIHLEEIWNSGAAPWKLWRD